MASLLPETDSDDELPNGWEQRVTLDGKVYFANHQQKTTQWDHPLTGKRKRVTGELPFGWERQVLDDGTVIYVDHANQKTTYTDPRLAFAIEDKNDGTDIVQRFDSSSTGYEVLNGRDLTKKVVIITGASAGIGLETAKCLASKGAHVVMACRDLTRAEEAVHHIRQSMGHARLTPIKCDLESLQSVKQFVDQFLSLNLPLHILILNAGIGFLPHILTGDGFEKTFQVNHLSHVYMTKLLKQKLIESRSRVVVVSSESHRFSYMSVETLSEEWLSPSAANYGSMTAYNDTKLCNVLFAKELNKRLSGSGVTANSLHPGNMMSTNFANNWWLMKALFTLVRPFTKSMAQGCATTVYCATAQELEGIGGLYFNNCCQCLPSKSAQNTDLSAALWNLTDNMIDRSLKRLDTQ